MDSYSILKFLHISSIALWIGAFTAQLVLLGRVLPLFEGKSNVLGGVARKLYLTIQGPAMAVVLGTGITQLMFYIGDVPDYFKDNRWLHTKFIFVLVMLVADHIIMQRSVKLAKGKSDTAGKLALPLILFGASAIATIFLATVRP